jgi:pseudomonalisin
MALSYFFNSSFPISRLRRQMTMPKLFAALPMLAICLSMAQAQAQTVDRLPHSFDPTPATVLPNHHPTWASPADDLGALNPNQNIDNLTLVLARSPEQQKAFDQFVEDQQNPGSPVYHHWLTPVEVGARFGLSDNDIASISGWLKSQGLHVDWVAPSKIFIGFGGRAASVGRAFGTEMHAYKVHGDDRISVSSDPMVPTALAPAFKAVRGLFTLQERPQNRTRVEVSDKPNLTISTSSGTENFIAPADFDVIYDVSRASPQAGAGVTIGIVAESRTDKADFDNFKALLEMTFNDPTEVVPTAYGGIDPGAAYTAPPACATATPPTCSKTVNEQIGAQSEATLDVLRSGSVASGASLLLVVNGGNDGIATDAQYLTETTPVPAQVMSISFGGCESEDGQPDVNFWDAIYQTGAAEGISTFVASGDGGAAECDTYFTTPPANPRPISPNALCSSSYATCVGGTEFNDTANSSTYWNSSNDIGSNGLVSALGYIPEGAWNEPGNATNGFEVAATGGGVSQYIPTPAWQTGTGVPSARTGRYTPDLAFSAAGHDAYFGCLSAIESGSCVSTAQGTPFVAFEGTSAAAPSMAGVSALLDQTFLGPQGNINSQIYTLAANAPAAFHDVTVTSSGVTSCSVGTPSMCNNSIPGPSSLTTGAEAGYLVQTGYDEATGWGSLDVNLFIYSFATEAGKITPTVQITPSPTTVTTAQSLTVSVTISGGSGNPVPTGTVTLSGGGYTSSAVTLSSAVASFPISAGALAAGNDNLTVNYTPDAKSLGTYFTASGTVSIAVSLPSPVAPTVSVLVTSPLITTGENESLTVTVAPVGSYPSPTGNVTITSGSYISTENPVSNGAGGAVLVNIPGGSLPLGTDTLNITYTPDTTGALFYKSASGTGTITVDPMQTPSINVSAPSSVTIAQSLQVTVTMGGTTGFPAPVGNVTLTSGSYSSFLGVPSNGVVAFTIPSETLPLGTDTFTAAFSGDYGIYNDASATTTVTVTTAPDFSLSASPNPISFAQGGSGISTITIAPMNGFTGSVAFTADNLPYGITASFAAGTTPDTETVTISATTTAAPGINYLTITGTSGSLTHTATVEADIALEPSFGPSGNGAASLTVNPGATTGNTVAVNVLGDQWVQWNRDPGLHNHRIAGRRQPHANLQSEPNLSSHQRYYSSKRRRSR